MYLEASRVFQKHEWQKRADWIASLFTHTLLKNEDGICYWAPNILPDFEVDLMSGSSGVIHFLMRYHKRHMIGQILLSK